MGTRLKIGATVALVVASTACGTGSAEDGLRIVATTTILADVASNVVGDVAEVISLIPPGADPHDYTPSSQDAAVLGSADLVVVNGLGLEEGLIDVVDAAADDGTRVLVVGPLLDPVDFGSREHGEDPDHDEEDEDHEGEGHDEDPHVWFDPLRMAEAARIVAAELATIDPSVDWAAAADAYAAELEEADRQIIEILSVIPVDRRVLVTNHDSLGYFAERYEFEVVGTVIPGGSTLANPSSADLAELVELIRTAGVDAIFVDSTAPTALADAVAAEVGTDVDVVTLETGSIGTGDGSDSLVEMLVENARRIAAALG